MSKITYYGFCGTCATRRKNAFGHAFLFAEQGNRVRIPDTEGIHRRIAVCTFEIASARQDSESSCNSKVLFSMREIPACGENRSLEGLSWLREKAEAMRLCEGKSSAHEWISQKTYKPRNEELTAWRSFLSAYLSIPLRSQEKQDTKAMVMIIIVFFDT